MKRARLRKPTLSQCKDARPRDPVFLAPAAKSTPPMRQHPIPKHPQTLEVSWYRVVVEVASDDRLEPLSGLRHGIVHALAKLLLNLSQFGTHALADRRAPYHEAAQAVLPADVREAWEVELFGSLRQTCRIRSGVSYPDVIPVQTFPVVPVSSPRNDLPPLGVGIPR